MASEGNSVKAKAAVTASRFRRVVGGLLSALLLLPVPALAFTWATSGSNTSWTASGSTENISSFGPVTGHADWLSFALTSAADQNTSITLMRDFYPRGGNPSMSAQVLLANSGLQLQTGGSMQLQVWTTLSGQTSPQSNIIGPLSLSGPQSVGNQFDTGPSLFSGTRYTLWVSFSLSGNWSVSSSTITSKFND